MAHTQGGGAFARILCIGPEASGSCGPVIPAPWVDYSFECSTGATAMELALLHQRSELRRRFLSRNGRSRSLRPPLAPLSTFQTKGGGMHRLHLPAPAHIPAARPPPRSELLLLTRFHHFKVPLAPANTSTSCSASRSSRDGRRVITLHG